MRSARMHCALIEARAENCVRGAGRSNAVPLHARGYLNAGVSRFGAGSGLKHLAAHKHAGLQLRGSGVLIVDKVRGE